MGFYNKFLSLCNSHHKSPSKVVLEIGLTKSAVTRWKDGGFPTDATKEKIAQYFGVPVFELTDEAQKNKPDSLGVELTDMQKEAMEFILSLSDEQLEQFVRVGRAMIGEK